MKGAAGFGARNRSCTCHSDHSTKATYRPKQFRLVAKWLCVLAVGGLYFAPGGQPITAAAVMLTDGTQHRAALGHNTQISPDGTRVVFTADTPAGDVAALYSVPITGGPITQLHGGTIVPENYKQLGGSRLWWAGHSVFEITPDGQSVIHFAEPSVGNVDLYKAPIAGGASIHLASLTTDNVDAFQFDIASDSAHMVYYAHERSSPTIDNIVIYSVPTSGGQGPETLFDVPPPQYGTVGQGLPAISPDGSRVICADGNSLYIKDIDGGPATTLGTAGTGLVIGTAQFTADGSHVIYCARDTFMTDHQIVETYSVRADGGEPVLISSSSGNVPYGPIKGIQPGQVATLDGSHNIKAKTQSPGVTEFYSFSLDTGDSTLIGTVTTGTNRALDRGAVLHDVSGAVYRGTDDAEAMSLWYIPFADGTPVRLTDDAPKPESTPSFPLPPWVECRITPDDQTVVYHIPTAYGPELYSVPINGGPSVRLDHGPADLYVLYYMLTPDGNYVVYTVGGPPLLMFGAESTATGLYAVSVQGGTPWLLNDPLAPDQYIRGYEIAPDGTVVYWAGNQDAGYDLYSAPIPEPASLALLALGGAAMLGRRRKRRCLRAGS